MRSHWHLGISTTLAISATFFLWIWYVSGAMCENYPVCTFSPFLANISFLSVGVLCLVLSVIEGTIAVKVWTLRRYSSLASPQRPWNTRSATLLISIGVLLALFGMYGLNTVEIMCPETGCSLFELAFVSGPYWLSFYTGLALIVTGDLSVLRSKFPAEEGRYETLECDGGLNLLDSLKVQTEKSTVLLQ